MLFSFSQKRGDSHAILYCAVIGMPVKAFRVSAEKLFFVCASTAIGISARITEDGELVLSVEDEGPGIPAEDRERIFEPLFRRQTPQQANVPGHGLGLAICRRIVEAHGGLLTLGNAGPGAEFVITLPRRAS